MPSNFFSDKEDLYMSTLSIKKENTSLSKVVTPLTNSIVYRSKDLKRR